MRPKHWFYTLPLRLRSLFRRERAEQELSEELQFHLEQKTQEYVAAGFTLDEAQRKAQPRIRRHRVIQGKLPRHAPRQLHPGSAARLGLWPAHASQ